MGVVQGYTYMNEFDSYRDLTVCKIVAREDPDPSFTGASPTFRVKFGDGATCIAISEQLHPWYPV